MYGLMAGQEYRPFERYMILFKFKSIDALENIYKAKMPCANNALLLTKIERSTWSTTRFRSSTSEFRYKSVRHNDLALQKTLTG